MMKMENNYLSPPCSDNDDLEDSIWDQMQLKSVPHFSYENISSESRLTGIFSRKEDQISSRLDSLPSKGYSNVYSKRTKIRPPPDLTPVKDIGMIKNNYQRKDESSHPRGKLYCFICHSSVPCNEMNEHLFIGRVKCDECGWEEGSCCNFAMRNQILTTDDNCLHKSLHFTINPIVNFKKWFQFDPNKSSSSHQYFASFRGDVRCYLEHLKPLWKSNPWKNDILKCQESIGIEREEDIPELSPIKPYSLLDDIKKYKDLYYRCKKTKKFKKVNYVSKNEIDNKMTETCLYSKLKERKRRKRIIVETDPEEDNGKHERLSKKVIEQPISEEFIHHPEDGNYLILEEIVSDCKNCYSPLDPMKMTFFVSTLHTEVTCSECDLKYYFIIPPTDGSKHPIRILGK